VVGMMNKVFKLQAHGIRRWIVSNVQWVIVPLGGVECPTFSVYCRSGRIFL